MENKLSEGKNGRLHGSKMLINKKKLMNTEKRNVQFNMQKELTNNHRKKRKNWREEKQKKASEGREKNNQENRIRIESGRNGRKNTDIIEADGWKK